MTAKTAPIWTKGCLFCVYFSVFDCAFHERSRQDKRVLKLLTFLPLATPHKWARPHRARGADISWVFQHYFTLSFTAVLYCYKAFEALTEPEFRWASNYISLISLVDTAVFAMCFFVSFLCFRLILILFFVFLFFARMLCEMYSSRDI